VEAFLREKAAWVLKHFAKLEEERRRKPAIVWEQGRLLPFRGGRYPLRFLLDGGRDEVRLEEGQLWVSLPLEPGPRSFAEQVRERMLAWYRGRAEEAFSARVAHFKGLLGVEPLRVRVKQQKHRWGSCSAKGALNFNWQLILAPAEILDYVVVHELCHLIALNHSPRFWEHVERVLPDFRERKRWLRQNGFIMAL
jgi:predicted metal-dependent hydrolase